MTGKTPLTLKDLYALSVVAERNGTQSAFAECALQWATGAEAEVTRLLAENDALKAEVLSLHKSLAECVLHAEQGWARYENAKRLSISFQRDLEHMRQMKAGWGK